MSPSRASRGHGARAGAAIDVHRRRRSRRSRRTARCGWCRRLTRRARCGRRRGRAFSGRARECRSGRWRSPTGTARRICRWPRRCSSRPGSRCTCTRARRSRSGRSAARRSGCWRCSTRELSRQSVMDFLTDAKLPGGAARGVRRDLGVAMGFALARRGDRQGRRAVAAAARRGERRRQRRRAAGLGAASVPRTPAGSARFIADLDRRLRDRPARATLGRASRLPAGPAGALRRGRGRGDRRAAGPGAVHRAGGGGRLRLVPRRRRAGDRDAALRGRDRQPSGRVRRARA